MADVSPAEQAPARKLIARAVAGDEVAFAALYRDVQPRLLRYAASLVGPDADDVTSEAWLQIVRDLPGFAGDLDGFRAWSARIVRNRALDLLRAAGRRPARPTPTHALPEPAAADDTAGSALDRLSTDAAIGLIASLPREQSEAVLLRAVVGLDAKSAGAVLDKSAAAVRVASHRGLRRLARMLRDRRPDGVWSG
ncbi:MAG TPA: RNA polymerase sigma factor [Jatrophihabitans sp.]|nr:RNA polymerase sigma factor [Jatrophihabitans sp.]